ncbi:MAG: radical SAM protein [Kiritimatiellae bacterium]|nr:radical SAM protein [Kiritimatiellia bacterium]MDD5520883.1 radical SAM protein [Kiritimatiellia bacterium]
MEIWDDKNAFNWVDDYFAHVRPHFDVRETDSLLIIMPNKAMKLNRTGFKVLQLLKDGGSIGEIVEKLGNRSERRKELFHFLCDFRSLMTGCLGEGHNRKAVDTAPHTESFNILPVLSEIAVTYRCNLQCRFCYAACGCQKKDSLSSEMSARDVSRVLKIIRNEAKVPSVSFTGGEPLVRVDLEELVVVAKKIGLRVNLITNGTLLAGNDRAERLREAGLDSAQVSLEGPTAEVHDELTGVPGSYERTLKGISALVKAGIHIHTNTTISSGNARYLVDLVKLIKKLGLKRMSMNMVIPAGSAADIGLQVSYSEIWSIIEPVRAEARRLGIEFMWYSPTPMCILNPLAEGLGNKSCAACDGLLSIAPNGDVLPCSSYPQPVGNLFQKPFEEVWNSAAALFFRRKEYAPGECNGCGEFTACAGACPLYWSAMGTKELNNDFHEGVLMAERGNHAVA